MLAAHRWVDKGQHDSGLAVAKMAKSKGHSLGGEGRRRAVEVFRWLDTNVLRHPLFSVVLAGLMPFITYAWLGR
jgi:hypothetical protein